MDKENVEEGYIQFIKKRETLEKGVVERLEEAGFGDGLIIPINYTFFKGKVFFDFDELKEQLEIRIKELKEIEEELNNFEVEK